MGRKKVIQNKDKSKSTKINDTILLNYTYMCLLNRLCMHWLHWTLFSKNVKWKKEDSIQIKKFQTDGIRLGKYRSVMIVSPHQTQITFSKSSTPFFEEVYFLSLVYMIDNQDKARITRVTLNSHQLAVKLIYLVWEMSDLLAFSCILQWFIKQQKHSVK